MKSYQQKSFPLSTALVEKLQAGIDVCNDVPNVILQVAVTACQHRFHLTDGVQHSGVIFVNVLADVRGTQVRQFPDQVDGNLTGFCSTFIFQRAAEHGFVD